MIGKRLDAAELWGRTVWYLLRRTGNGCSASLVEIVPVGSRPGAGSCAIPEAAGSPPGSFTRWEMAVSYQSGLASERPDAGGEFPLAVGRAVLRLDPARLQTYSHDAQVDRQDRDPHDPDRRGGAG